MIVTRRGILKGGAVLTTAAALPRIASAKASIVTVYDSRIPESRVFAGTLAKIEMIDIACEAARNWAGLRHMLADTQHIKGLTGWSDWVTARGFLEERGLRLVSETSVPAPLSGKAHLFAWEMRG